MWPYWIMYLVPSLMALNATASGRRGPANVVRSNSPFPSIMIWLVLSLLVGYRFQVGGDWYNYLRYLTAVNGLDFAEVIVRPDPSYQLLNWLSLQMDWGIYGVNVIAGAIFAFGLVEFCKAQPQPWLALAVATPYLIIVVGMGYSRQAVALSLEMLGLLSLMNGSTRSFVLWTVMAATFHKTALLLLPISALASSSNRYWTALWVGVTTAVFYYFLLAKDTDTLVKNYFGGQMQSSGAAIRLSMNAVAGAIYLVWRGRFSLPQAGAALWKWLAAISLLLLGLLLVLPSASTALDRIALYMLPLQVMVFSHLPFLFVREGYSRNRLLSPRASSAVWTTAVLGYYGLVLFVWLNFADYSYAWREYRFYWVE